VEKVIEGRMESAVEYQIIDCQQQNMTDYSVEISYSVLQQTVKSYAKSEPNIRADSIESLQHL
jgi:hypothetical protein